MSAVNHPKHYTSCSLECLQVMQVTFGRKSVFHFCINNAFKYLWRYKDKNGEEDLKKAKWYLDYCYNNLGIKPKTELGKMFSRVEKLYLDVEAEYQIEKADHELELERNGL